VALDWLFQGTAGGARGIHTDSVSKTQTEDNKRLAVDSTSSGGFLPLDD